MRRDERWCVPRLERLETRNLLSALAGRIHGDLVTGPLAGNHIPPGDFRILGSGSIDPLGRIAVSGISPTDEMLWRLTVRDHRAYVRLHVSGPGSPEPGLSYPVLVVITGHSPGIRIRTGGRGAGTIEEGSWTPGGTRAFQLTIHIP
jgi:hypothetical protein